MRMLKKICAATLSGIMAMPMMISGFPVSAAESYAINLTFDDTYEKLDEYNGNDIIYGSVNAQTNKDTTSSNNPLGMSGTMTGLTVKIISDEAVTGKSDKVLCITNTSGTAANGTVYFGGPKAPKTMGVDVTEQLVVEFDVRMPDADKVTNEDKYPLSVHTAISGGGDKDWQQFRRDVIYPNGGSGYSEIGISSLDPAKWYKITQVYDLTNCTKSIYIDDVLYVSQQTITSGFVKAGTWGSASFKWLELVWGSASFVPAQDIRLFLDNIRVYPETHEDSAKRDIKSVKKQIEAGKIYTPVIGSEIYEGSRVDGNMTATTTTANTTPNYSFSSSNQSVVTNDGDFLISEAPAGNEPDKATNLTVNSKIYAYESDGNGGYVRNLKNTVSEVIPIKYESPKLTSYDSTLTIGQPVITNSGGIYSAESYVTSTLSKEETLAVAFYDESMQLVKAATDKKTVNTVGAKLAVSTEIPTNARYVRFFMWDSSLRPAIATDMRDLLREDIPVGPTQITIPSDFATLDFDITRQSARKYTHNAAPENQAGGETLDVYIADHGTTSGLGLTAAEPVSYNRFTSNYRDGLYASYFTDSTDQNFVLNITDNYYQAVTNIQPKDTMSGADIIFRGAAESGPTWFGTFARQGVATEIAEDFSDGDGDGVYKTVLKERYTHSSTPNIPQVMHPINLKNLDAYGIPKHCYTRADSLAECIATEGTFYQQVTDSATSNGYAVFDDEVYVHPFADEKIADIDLSLYTTTSYCQARMQWEFEKEKVIYDNIAFTSHSFKFQPYTKEENADEMALMFFDCKFYRGNATGALNIMSPPAGYTYNVYVFDSVAAYGYADGFNYHGIQDALAVEINCVSYGNGESYIPYWSNDKGPATVKTKNHSNNGSTAHDGVRMLRVGSKYWDCEGPIVADLSGYNISIGCEASTVLDTTTGVRAAFYAYNDMTGATEDYTNKPKYFIECHAGGSNVLYGVYAGSGNSQVYTLDCTADATVGSLTGKDTSTYPGYINAIPSWDDISTGTWYPVAD